MATLPKCKELLPQDIGPEMMFLVHDPRTGKDRRFLYGSLVSVLHGATSQGTGIQRGDGLGKLVDTGKTFPLSTSDIIGLSTVATTGVYADLLSKPTLFSGAYGDLTGKPTLLSDFTNDLGLGAAAYLGVGGTSGLVQLSGGLVPTANMPPLSINETFTPDSQVAMLALTAQRGDMAIRSDNGKTYVLASDSPSTLADWKEISSAGAVSSVNGQTGTVSLTTSDVVEGTNLYFTSARVADKQPLHANLTAIANSTAFSGLTYRMFVMEGGAFTAKQVTANRYLVTNANGSPEAMSVVNGRILQTNATTGAPELSTTTSTELGWLNGITGPVQTQLNARQPVAGVLTTLSSLNLTGQRVLQSIGGTLNALALTGSAWVVTQSDGTLGTAAANVSTTEFSYLDGVTSSIQTQLDGKILKSIGTTKGDLIVYSGNNSPTRLAAGTNTYVLTADSTTATGLKWAAGGGGGGSVPTAFQWTAATYTGSVPGTGLITKNANLIVGNLTDSFGKLLSITDFNFEFGTGAAYRIVIPATGLVVGAGAVTSMVASGGGFHLTLEQLIAVSIVAGNTYEIQFYPAAGTSTGSGSVTGTSNEITATRQNSGRILSLPSTFGKKSEIIGSYGGSGTAGMPGAAGTAGTPGAAGENWTDGTYFYTGGSGGPGGTANGGLGGEFGGSGTPGAAGISDYGVNNTIQVSLVGGNAGTGGDGGVGGSGGTGLNGENGQNASPSGNGANGADGASANGGTGGTGGPGGTGGAATASFPGSYNLLFLTAQGGNGTAGTTGGAGENGGYGTSGSGTGTTGSTGASGAGASLTVSGFWNQLSGAFYASGTEYQASMTVSGHGNQFSGYATPGTVSISGSGNNTSAYLPTGGELSISGHNNIVTGKANVTGNGCIIAAHGDAGASIEHSGVLATGTQMTKSHAVDGHINNLSHRYVGSRQSNAGTLISLRLAPGVYSFSVTCVQNTSGGVTGYKAGRKAGYISVVGAAATVTVNVNEDYAGAGMPDVTIVGDTSLPNLFVNTSSATHDVVAELFILGLNINANG